MFKPSRTSIRNATAYWLVAMLAVAWASLKGTP